MSENELQQNTPEFAIFQKEAAVKFEQAEKIFLDFFHKDTANASLKPKFLYAKNGYYFFGASSDPLYDKMKRSWTFYKLKVDSKTGDYEEIEGVVSDEIAN